MRRKGKRKKSLEVVSEPTGAAMPHGSRSDSVAFGGRVVALLKDPIFALVVSLAISFVFYFISIAEMEPAYASDSPETLARAESGVEGLRITYNGRDVGAVYRTKIAIWNAGRRAIDATVISRDQNVCVRTAPGVVVLSHRIARTSRRDLRFTTNYMVDQFGPCVAIRLVGDEALESKDGLLLELVYAGREDAGVRVTGRIKGSRSGFKKTVVDDVSAEAAEVV